MDTKKCSKCGEVKAVGEFSKCSRNKDGLRGQCRKCRTAYSKEYKQTNCEITTAYMKEYRKANRESIASYKKEWQRLGQETIAARKQAYYQTNRETIAMKQKEYTQANKESVRKRLKKWRQANRETAATYGKKYREANRETIAEQQKAYQQANKATRATYIKKYMQKRLHSEPLFKLKATLRGHTRRIKTKFGARSRTASLLGCSFKDALTHLIQTAVTQYGFYDKDKLYHIDHIIPLSSATTEEEAIALCHISNLQYLTPEDNLTKSDRMDWQLRA